jgi:prevent-host-death family protein
MVMIMVNIAEAKAKLSELLDAAGRGEQVMICNHNRPVAELRAVEGVASTPRDLSPLYPNWTIDPAFFEPLPPDEIALWEGGPADDVRRVAETSPEYSEKRPRTRRRK